MLFRTKDKHRIIGMLMDDLVYFPPESKGFKTTLKYIKTYEVIYGIYYIVEQTYLISSYHKSVMKSTTHKSLTSL